MSKSITLQIADQSSPEELRGKVMVRFTDDELGVTSALSPAPANVQAALKSLFADSEAAALDAESAATDAKKASIAARRAELERSL